MTSTKISQSVFDRSISYSTLIKNSIFLCLCLFGLYKIRTDWYGPISHYLTNTITSIIGSILGYFVIIWGLLIFINVAVILYQLLTNDIVPNIMDWKNHQ